MSWRAVLPLFVLGCAALATGCSSSDAGETRGFYAEVRVEVEPQSDDPLARTGPSESGGVIRWWYAPEPGRWRWEIEAGGSPIDGGTLTTVVDGEEYWSYDDRSNTYQRTDAPALPPGTVLPPTLSTPVGPANVESVEAFMEQWRDRGTDSAVQHGGEETVLGRSTQIVEIRPVWHSSSGSAEAPAPGEQPAPAEELAASGGVVRAYIDPERMFVMRWTVDGEGGGQSYSAEITKLDYGVTIDEERFMFEPPSGASEVAMDDGQTCHGSSGSVGDATVPGQPGFLRPSYVPPGYTSTGAGSEGGASGCEIVATWALLESEGRGYLLLRQRRRASVPEAVRDWQTVDVDGHEGYRQSEGGVERLVWRDGEIVAMLESDALPFDELLRMAESAVVEPAGSSAPDPRPSAPTRTPQTVDPSSLPPVPYAGPTLGETARIDFGEPQIRPVRFTGEALTVPEFQLPTTPVLLYDGVNDELWMLDGTAAFGLWFSPFGEEAVATAFWAVSDIDQGSAEPETVIVDLEAMTVRRLLPVSATDVRWASPTVMRLAVRETRERERPHDWQPGLYEVDLEASTVTLVELWGQFRRLSPDGGFELLSLPPARDPERLVVRELATGVETEIHRFAEGESPAGELWLAGSNRLLFEVNGQRYYSWQPGEAEAALVLERDAPTDGFLPSPDGRYLAVSGSEGTSVLDLDGERATLGPYPETWPASWHPTRAGTLMLLDGYCAGTGQRASLAELNTETGQVTPVAEGLDGFWEFLWSGRGDAGVGWAGDLYLIDPKGDAQRLEWADAFRDASAPIQRWLQWSANGRWLYAWGQDGGHGSPCYLRTDLTE